MVLLVIDEISFETYLYAIFLEIGNDTFFEFLELGGSQSVSFCNNWNEINFVLQPLHEFHVQLAQAKNLKCIF